MSTSVFTHSESATVCVRLENQLRWLQLELSLDGEWDGGRLVQRGPSVANLQPADDRARTYDLETWESGIASGAFYAYRALGRPRRRIIVTGLQGLLSSEDMTALASAAALGVAKLLGGDLPDADLSGWKVSVSMSEGPNRVV